MPTLIVQLRSKNYRALRAAHRLFLSLVGLFNDVIQNLLVRIVLISALLVIVPVLIAVPFAFALALFCPTFPTAVLNTTLFLLAIYALLAREGVVVIILLIWFGMWTLMTNLLGHAFFHAFNWASCMFWLGNPIVQNLTSIDIPLPLVFLISFSVCIYRSSGKARQHRNDLKRLWFRYQIETISPSSEAEDSCATPAFWILSDLHLTKAEQTPREFEYASLSPYQRKRFGGDQIASNAERILEHIVSSARPQTVIVAGDITDEGSDNEWEICQNLLTKYSGTVEFLLVPGNHDVLLGPRLSMNPLRWWKLNGVRSGNKWRMRQLESVQQELTRGFLHATSPRKTVQVNESAPDDVPISRDAVQSPNKSAPANDFDDDDSMDTGLFNGRVLKEPPRSPEIPVRLFCEGKLRTIIVNSNERESSMLISNAIGKIGETQIQDIEAVLKEWQGTDPLVVVMHHHPARCSDDALGLGEMNLYMLALNGGRLIQALDEAARARSSYALIVHGHRHLQRFGRIGRVYICGLASSTLGDQKTSTNAIPDMIPRCSMLAYSEISQRIIITVCSFSAEGALESSMQYVCAPLNESSPMGAEP